MLDKYAIRNGKEHELQQTILEHVYVTCDSVCSLQDVLDRRHWDCSVRVLPSSGIVRHELLGVTTAVRTLYPKYFFPYI